MIKLPGKVLWRRGKGGRIAHAWERYQDFATQRLVAMCRLDLEYGDGFVREDKRCATCERQKKLLEA